MGAQWSPAHVRKQTSDVERAAARFAINSWWYQEGERQSADIPLIIDWLQRYQVAVNKVLGRGPSPDDPVSIGEGRLRRARLALETDARAGENGDTPPDDH